MGQDFGFVQPTMRQLDQSAYHCRLLCSAASLVGDVTSRGHWATLRGAHFCRRLAALYVL